MLTRQTGQQAEHLALNHLLSGGLNLITRNFSCRMGEIDLIMQDRSLLHPHILVFVEVRYRRSSSHGGAAASITPVKRQRLIRTARRFIQIYPRYRNWPCRFDVIALSGDHRHPQLKWLKSAFHL